MAKGILQLRDFIVDYVRRNQPVSRLGIAREFEMYASTVGNIVEGLLEDGLLIETDECRETPSAGRPPRFLRVNPGSGQFLGIDVYRRQLTAVLTDFSGNLRGDTSVSFPARADRRLVIGAMISASQRLLTAEGASPDSLKGIGVGLPGLVDREAGVALSYRPIRRWQDVPVRDILESTLWVPASVEHNSNTMALGEACFGDAAPYDHVVSVLLRTGVSLGEAQHRDIPRTSPIGAGELGHTIINVRGPRCWCGTRGCLEAYASGWALRKRLWRHLRHHPDWPGRDAFDEQGVFDPAVICELARNGDPKSEESLRNVFHYLAIGVNTIARLIAPDAVVINGSFNAAGDLIREEILAVLNRPLDHPLRIPQVIVSSQGDRMGALGAALMAASRFCNPVHRIPV